MNMIMIINNNMILEISKKTQMIFSLIIYLKILLNINLIIKIN